MKQTWFSLNRVQMRDRWRSYEPEGRNILSLSTGPDLISSGTVSYHAVISRSSFSKSRGLSSRITAGSK